MYFSEVFGDGESYSIKKHGVEGGRGTTSWPTIKISCTRLCLPYKIQISKKKRPLFQKFPILYVCFKSSCGISCIYDSKKKVGSS